MPEAVRTSRCWVCSGGVSADRLIRGCLRLSGRRTSSHTLRLVRRLLASGSYAGTVAGRHHAEAQMLASRSCIPHLVGKLDSLGYTTERLSEREPVAQSFQAIAAAKRRTKEEPAPSPKEEKDDDDETKGGLDAVPTKYWRLDTLSKKMLRDRLVCAIELVILSPANLRVHLDPAGNSSARERLLEIIEATTGIPPSMPITGQMRDWTNLTRELVSRAEVRGRRALRISFPLQWDDFLFTIIGADDSGHVIMVEHNFNSFRVQVPRHKLPDFESLSDLAISRNYSERLAAIYNKKTKCDREYLLANDFTNHEVDDMSKFTTPKKARTIGSSNSASGSAGPHHAAATAGAPKLESDSSSAPPPARRPPS